MPKAFSQREKELIHHQLLETGKALIRTFGIKKTNVEDLTRSAGISKGAFYLFYQSKEELFLEVLEIYEKELQHELLQIIASPGTDAKQSFIATMKKAISIVESSSMMKLLSKEELAYLQRKMPEEKMKENMENDFYFIQQFIEKLNEQYSFKKFDLNNVIGVVKAIFFLSLEKENFGLDLYPYTIDTLLEMLAGYMIEE